MVEINTTKGMIEESLLVKTEGSFNDDNELTSWTEWRDESGEIVRRDVHVRLKKVLDLTGILESSNG
jgi:hypothetical protein